jgi:hypothetical protein
VRAASGSGFPLRLACLVKMAGWGAWEPTLAVYEDICSLSVGAQQYGVVVDLGLGKAR